MLFSAIHGAVVPGQTASRPPRDKSDGRPALTPAPGQSKSDIAASLAKASPAQQKQVLGDNLYMLIMRTQPQLAGNITGMLLDGLDTAEIVNLIDSPEALDARIKLALKALQTPSEA